MSVALEASSEGGSDTVGGKKLGNATPLPKKRQDKNTSVDTCLAW